MEVANDERWVKSIENCTDHFKFQTNSISTAFFRQIAKKNDEVVQLVSTSRADETDISIMSTNQIF